MKSLAIVVRDDSYDKILTPLAFAYLEASEGVQVDILFVNWAVKALSKDGVEQLKVDGRHAGEEERLRSQVKEAGLPAEIREIIKALKSTGRVKLYACSLAANIFGVGEKDLLPEADGIVGASWFLNEKAFKADHCQYF
jgi:peroxiredoxin family protein